jgi:hypothetical protein
VSPRPQLATLATAAALLLCGAFIVSFLYGLRGGDSRRSAPASPIYNEASDGALGRVEVLNASGRAGLARAATDRLRSAGFDVVFFGNAGTQHGDSSVVIARTASDAAARAAARQLGIAPVIARPDTALFLDATVVIGKDWAGMQETTDRREGFWGRVRRWFSPG